jgi:nitroreductase
MSTSSGSQPTRVNLTAHRDTHSVGENAGENNGRIEPRTHLDVGPMFPHFSKQEVADEHLAWVIDVAHQGGPEWNLRPWRWIVVRANAAKARLESASHIEVPLSSAPVILICLVDTLAWKSAPQHVRELVSRKKITEGQGHEILNRVQEYYSASPEIAQRTALADGLVAVHQALLGAASCGLSAYWVTEFDEVKIKTYFHIPDQFAVAALLSIGHCDGPSALAASKDPPGTLIYQEKFGETAVT